MQVSGAIGLLFKGTVFVCDGEAEREINCFWR